VGRIDLHVWHTEFAPCRKKRSKSVGLSNKQRDGDKTSASFVISIKLSRKGESVLTTEKKPSTQHGDICRLSQRTRPPLFLRTQVPDMSSLNDQLSTPANPQSRRGGGLHTFAIPEAASQVGERFIIRNLGHVHSRTVSQRRPILRREIRRT
jgi:hypothetical protein